MKGSVRYGQDAIREEIADLEEKRRSLAAAEFSPEYMWRQSHEEQSRIRKEKRVALRKLDEQIETLKTYLQDPDGVEQSGRWEQKTAAQILADIESIAQSIRAPTRKYRRRWIKYTRRFLKRAGAKRIRFEVNGNEITTRFIPKPCAKEVMIPPGLLI